MSDGLPTGRAAWRRAFPTYQERYLAWCNDTRRTPPDIDGAEYCHWIQAKSASFRQAKGIKRDMVPLEHQDEFTEYLWGGELDLE